MGRDWMYLDELKFPKKCPYCGGNRFVVEGAKKVEFEATFKVTEKGIETEDEQNTDIEWKVAYGLICADCGEDLSEEVGLD
jgi:DNA-directed RNA polymerase subunit RPC12/RpoP